VADLNGETMPEKTVKCLVWDLDHTLWQGILLEDGRVTLADDLREVVVELDRRGILQSVASRNDHDHAWEWLEKLGLAEYFVFPRIGWGRKSDAVRAIADDLSFSLDTVAFIDDQPVERAEVTHHLPQVRCYDAAEATTLPTRPEFTPAVVTADAARRRGMVQAGVRRDAERDSFAGADEEFLRTLDMRMAVYRARADDLARVEELTLRTSQMNATGVHYSEETLRGLVADPDHEVLVCTLDDRFGPHGAVGIVLLARHPGSWRLKLLATSCRVVAFGAGAVLLRWLTDQAARGGVHLAADFRRTDRNRMMEVAYRFAGFTDEPCPCLDGLPRTDGVALLHLAATGQCAPTTMTVTGPPLADAADAGVVVWR
jgi:methoxymalonate biosynthesis protein